MQPRECDLGEDEVGERRERSGDAERDALQDEMTQTRELVLRDHEAAFMPDGIVGSETAACERLELGVDELEEGPEGLESRVVGAQEVQAAHSWSY